MRKIALLLSILCFSIFSIAQISESERSVALQLVQANKKAIGITDQDLQNSVITHTYIIANSDVRMVYLQQSYKDVLVYNTLHVLAFRGQQLVSKAGERIERMEEKVTVASGIPSLDATTAVKNSLADVQLTAKEVITPVKVSNNNKKYEFTRLGVTSEEIFAELLWMPIEGKKEVSLVWQVFVTPGTASDYWLIRVDAATGVVLNKENLTITCNWGDGKHTVDQHIAENHGNKGGIDDRENKRTIIGEYVIQRPDSKSWHYKPFVVNSATYRVVPYPAESPWHPGGSYAIRTDPWNLSPSGSPATTLKWHDDGTGDYNYTRGNNVWAQEDLNGNNGTGTPATSTTALPDLTFDFAPDTTVSPTLTTPPNQQFNITNLFYWNNLMHDIAYQYGFDEVSRNFQEDNLSRGGAGSDHVFADAQDGAGTNNANFATPADGSNPRMQMFLWNFNGANPMKDGDADNGVIAHEYTHGISNRLTGSGSGCLSNAEHMGEGWSDYYALMVTHDWATATPADGFNNPRPIGLYALNGGGLFGVPGIRHFPYSTNMAVNPSVYLATLPSSPHDRGEIWAATLWDMTWNIIQQSGINANIFDATGTGGNVVALKLVTEGLRLQGCSPGFISGRDAILQADTIFYGGVHSCAIWDAFARRGMGVNASQGSSSSRTDQVPDFTGFGPSIVLTQGGITAVPEGQNIIYNNAVTVSNCGDLVNYTLRDTLPANVTFVSATNGGTYDPVNRVVSWPVNITAGNSANYGFTVTVNMGSYYPPVSLINEDVPSTTISPFWTATSTTANVWTAHNLRSHSAPNSFFTPNGSIVSDQTLATTNSFALGAAPPVLSFWHWYNVESGFDGCALEISTNGGSTWSDIGSGNILQNGYNGTVSSCCGNPLSGRSAWTGNSSGFVETRVNLSSFANQPDVKLRWRFGSDNTVSSTGWNVDDIVLEDIAQVYMQSVLFNDMGMAVETTDTITLILPSVTCTPPTVNAPTVTQPTCPVPTGTIEVNATGSGTLEYSVDNGATYQTSNIFSGLAPGNYDIIVRFVSSPSCMTVYSGNPVVLNTPSCGGCTLTCPANITVSNDAGQCGAIVNYPAPTTTGGCGTITSVPASGSFFPIGTTTVTVTSSSGPVCTFDITVNDTENPVITCPANITVSNDAGECGAVVSYSVTATDNCPGVTVTSTPASGTVFPVGTTTVTSTATDANGNSVMCTFTVTVNDTEVPVFGSNPLIPEMLYYKFDGTGTTVDNLASAPPSGTATATIVGAQTQGTAGLCDNGALLGTGGSSSTNYVNTGWTTSFSGSWTISFKTSNIQPSTTLFYVFGDNTAGSFRCFTNGVAGADNWMLRGTGITDVVAAGAATTGTHTTTFVYDAVAGNIKAYVDGALVNTVAQGTITNSGSGPFKVGGYATSTGLPNGGLMDEFGLFGRALNDAEVAELAGCPISSSTCPDPITVNNDPGECGAVVTYDVPAAVDNCPGVTVTQTAGLSSGSQFPVGVTTNIFTATDAAGNTATCSFDVTVNDNEAPTVNCPADITVTAIGACTALVNYSVTAADNCPGATTSLVSGPASGSQFPIGTTTVTWMATDAAGNTSATCSFNVTVIDGQLPVITAQPVDVTACSGTYATFSVTSTNVISYQWQSWNGSSWNNIAGATSTIYTVNNVNTGMNTNTFRVIINGLCTTVISEPASLYVNSLPIVQLSASPEQTLLPGQTTSIFASSTPAGGSYAWFMNGSPINNTGSTLVGLDIDDLGVYSVVYTDANGCIASSNSLAITATPSEKVFVYPNPNTGAFQIRFYSSTSEPVTVTIFDSKGARVYQKRMISTSPYSRLDVNLTGSIPGGVYVVEVVNAQGERIGTRRIHIGH